MRPSGDQTRSKHNYYYYCYYCHILFLPHSSTEYNYKICMVLILEGKKNHSADWENQKKTEMILRYIYTKFGKNCKGFRGKE